MMSQERSDQRRRWIRLATWSYPVVGVGVALVSQVAVPRLLQVGMSEADYAVFVAVSSIALYVGVGEGGVQLSLLRELSARHGAGERDAFAAEARRAKKIFGAAALLGGLFAAGALLSQRAMLAALDPSVLVGALALVVSSMLELAVGGFHTAMLCSTGRLLSSQVTNTSASLVSQLVLIAALALTRDLASSIWALAMTRMAVTSVRGIHAGYLLREETRDTDRTTQPSPIVSVVGPGTLLKLADVLQASSYPHMLTALAPWTVASAIPGRTYANATRLVSQQFVNLLQVHVTRGLAGSEAARRRSRENYRIASSLLTSAQLLQLAVTAAVAETVFALWLPEQAQFVRETMPGLFLAQALLSASLPADILFVAAGKMRDLGVARLVSTLLGLATVAWSLGSMGRGALGFGVAISAIPLFGFALHGELSSLRDATPSRVETSLRYVFSVGCALSFVRFAKASWLPVFTCTVTGLVGLTWAVFLLWRRSRS